jgi:serine/threonine protein kinase
MSTATDATRWERLKTLFADALDLPVADRAAFLDAACAGDDALRAEVEALLAAEPAAEAALESWVDRLAPVRAQALAETEDAALPLQIGPYRLVREVGRGGMGTVFLAERADGQYAQRVALKLIRAGAASPEAQRRFRAERQILARLAHPHIARLLDGGVTPPAADAPEGLPYLVMEYVEGVPLLAYGDAWRLGLDARLALFLDVCEGVAAAHRALVVHRDLKPSNVLVAEDAEGRPQVKLLDFGIAKLLDDADDGAGLTRSGAHPMTPAYAAPEQVRGEPVTTATDVYALGLVLYELLTGRRPFVLEGRTPAEVERLLDTTEPARPSTALLRADDAAAQAEARGGTPERLARRLRGDLDTIVLKALRREPARRYASVGELADDLRRHRARLPVHARPDTAGYRVGRFLQRHRVGVAAAALVLLAVLGGAGAALWQARQARLEAEKAEATLAFLQNTLWGAEPGTGDPDATIRDALDSAAVHIERDLADQPLVAAGVHHVVASSYYSLGQYERAEPHHRRALALYAAAGRRHRLDYGIELLNLAMSLDGLGRGEEALPLYERAIRIQRAHGTRVQVASGLNGYAAALDAIGRYDEAERHYREAIALWREEGTEHLPLALNNLAILYEQTRRTREAVPLVEEAVRALRAQGPSGAPELATALATLGVLYDYTGRPAEGAATLDEALGLLRRLLGPEHPATLLNTASRALVDVRAGRPAEALPFARAAYDGVRRTLPDDHPFSPHALTIYGQALCGLGPDSARAGEGLTRRALAIRRGLYPPEHFLVALTESVHGGCLTALGRFGEAEPLLTSGYHALRAARGEADARTADARARLDAFSAATGRAPAARRAGS